MGEEWESGVRENKVMKKSNKYNYVWKTSWACKNDVSQMILRVWMSARSIIRG